MRVRLRQIIIGKYLKLEESIAVHIRKVRKSINFNKTHFSSRSRKEGNLIWKEQMSWWK